MKAVLKHAGRWLHFQDPERVLKAGRIEEVIPLLREAEASGLFAVGFVSYEAASAFDAALTTYVADEFPLLYLGLFHAPDVLDNIEEAPGCSYDVGDLVPSVSRASFCDAIHSIKERIAEGATYQVNYTYRLNAGFSGDPWAFFYALVKGQKTEYAAYVETDDFAICSASPELFFSLSDGVITTRPMKGTARRGRTLAEDRIQADMLQTSEKDRAENIMIVDMIRNDIGRVAATGSVETVSTYDVEKYPTVWQMTSTVRGQIMPHEGPMLPTNPDQPVGLEALMRALFPCASITGAPKAKTMEIIRELECSPRKIYTGAIGFASPRGEACFNVAIRTALVDKVTQTLEFGVGGGIVWDSDAESEYEETLTKARVLTQPRPRFKLLETMLWEQGSGVFLLNEHMQRLERSAAYFDIPLDVPSLLQRLDTLTHSFEHTRYRIRVLVALDGQTEFQFFPMGDVPDAETFKLVKPAVHPIDSGNHFLFHKTTFREPYEKAKADFPDVDDVILWNSDGNVTESCVANIVIRKGADLITPPVECGLLAGTFREHLLETGAIKEGIITLEQLKSAEEVFLINSVRKWQRAKLEV